MNKDDSFKSDAERVFALVRQISKSRVMSYGQVGQLLDPPVSSRSVGRIMAHCPEGVPWWRVVGVHGDLLIHKRNPQFAQIQKQLLIEEGVKFIENRVDMTVCRHLSEFID